jgi:hypothetical protein
MDSAVSSWMAGIGEVGEVGDDLLGDFRTSRFIGKMAAATQLRPHLSLGVHQWGM